MKPITPERQRAFADNYKSMLGHYAEAKRKTHHAMYHPDITPDELPQILAFIGNARRGATVREAMRATPRTTPH